MLVLSRKSGEKLIIGDNITIVVNRVAGNRVTLGIEAPSSVRVIRGELQKPREEATCTAAVCATAAEPTAEPAAVACTPGEFESHADPGAISLLRLAK